MIKAIHIEDEPGNVLLLQRYVNIYCSDTIRLEGHAGSISEGIKLIEKVKPQLVYLDIELKGGSAFDLLDHFEEIKFEILFVTAFNQYAVRAFRCNAVDYIVKPVNTDEFIAATQKAVERIHNHSGSHNLKQVMHQVKMDFGGQKLGIPVFDGIEFIELDDIIKIQAKGSYSQIHLSNKKVITCSKNLKYLEQMLPESSFLRVHHSWIINLKYLKKYYRGKNGYMEMQDGSNVPVSIRKKSKFLKNIPE